MPSNALDAGEFGRSAQGQRSLAAVFESRSRVGGWRSEGRLADTYVTIDARVSRRARVWEMVAENADELAHVDDWSPKPARAAVSPLSATPSRVLLERDVSPQ